MVTTIRNGDLTETDPLPRGQVVAGPAPARRSPDDIVFSNSVGLAREKRIGTLVTF